MGYFNLQGGSQEEPCRWKFRTLYRADLPASQSPFRVVDENGCELEWANRFLDAQCLRGLAALSLRGYANTLLHFVRWWLHQPGVDILVFRAENFTESTLLDYVRSQVDQNPRPTPENINNRSYMLKRLFRFYFQQDMPHSPYCVQRQWNRPADCGRRGPMPSADLKLKVPHRVIEPLSQEQVHRFCETDRNGSEEEDSESARHSKAP